MKLKTMDSLSSHRTPLSPPSDGSKEAPLERNPSPLATASKEIIREALSELRTLRPDRPEHCGPDAGIHAAATVGESDAIQRLRSQIKRIAPYFRTALVTGNPGTGKEGVARMLHALSPCADGEFIAIEATALAETMMRDEAGPMMDAVAGTATGGTLYLSEVGEVPLPLQGALLRVWSASGRGKMRVVAGTHRDLRTMGVTGQFRPDLAQRLMGIELAVPALGERREDLAAVIREVLRCAGAERELKLSADAMARLLAHRWPGDVAEVDEVIRAAANSAGRRTMIETGNLPELRADTPDADDEVRMQKLEDVVRQHVLGVLTRCGGNKLRAAEILGISRSTLYRMLETCVGEGFAIG
jgi:DNA-binding NtrC family response regulator